METKIVAKKVEIISLVTLNYFNFRLNLYEPLVEKFSILISYKSDSESKNISIDFDDYYPFNINLSTALFENIVICMSYINETMVKGGYREPIAQNSKINNILMNLESGNNNYDYRYTLENQTGEELMVATHETDEFVNVYANQIMNLDFTNKYEEHVRNQPEPISKDQSRSFRNNRLIEQNLTIRSPYRKENFKIQGSFDERMKKVYLLLPSFIEENSLLNEESERYFLNSCVILKF